MKPSKIINTKRSPRISCISDFTYGFTLVEIIIAISILAITASVALGFDVSSLRHESLADTRQDFVAALQSARSQSMNGMCTGTCTDAVAHGVHVETHQYVEFQGNSYSSSDVQDFPHLLSDGTYFLATTDIIFQPISGNATATTIILRGENGSATTSIINDAEITW